MYTIPVLICRSYYLNDTIPYYEVAKLVYWKRVLNWVLTNIFHYLSNKFRKLITFFNNFIIYLLKTKIAFGTK